MAIEKWFYWLSEDNVSSIFYQTKEIPVIEKCSAAEDAYEFYNTAGLFPLDILRSKDAFAFGVYLIIIFLENHEEI